MTDKVSQTVGRKRYGSGRGERVMASFRLALPVMIGYIVLGLPAGILCEQSGMSILQVLILTLLMYSGAGQYMIANMLITGSTIGSLVLSVALVNTRQMLYASSLAPYLKGERKGTATLFAATVTDETFGLNLIRLSSGLWTSWQAILVNLFSFATWTTSVVVGAAFGNAVGIPSAIASFAMTSIFICLLASQSFSRPKVVAALATVCLVVACKLTGFSGISIFAGAVGGIAVGMLIWREAGHDKRGEKGPCCGGAGAQGSAAEITGDVAEGEGKDADEVTSGVCKDTDGRAHIFGVSETTAGPSDTTGATGSAKSSVGGARP